MVHNEHDTQAAAATRGKDNSEDKSSNALSSDKSTHSARDSHGERDTASFVAAAAATAAATTTAPAPSSTTMTRDKRAASSATYTVDALTGLMTFHSRRALRAYAQSRQTLWRQGQLPYKPCLVVYKSGVYDVSEFVHAHPGGRHALERFAAGDVTVAFHDATHYHAHSPAALSILYQYRIGNMQCNDDDNNNNNNDNDNDVDNNAIEHDGKDSTATRGGRGVADDTAPQPPRVDEAVDYPIITPRAVFYRGFAIRRDCGMMWQAMHLPLAQYQQFVDQPIFLMQCRLFDTPALELLTRTKYWVVPLLWLPLSAFWFARGVLRDNTQLNEQWGSCLDRYLYYPNDNVLFRNYPAPVTARMAASYVHGTTPQRIAHEQLAHARAVSRFCALYPVLVFLLGLFAWTPLEYVLHRFAFHYDRLLPRAVMDNAPAKLVHLVLHGIHHVIPMDRDRLVFPPALFAVMCVIIYHVVGLFITGSCLDLVAAGLTLGYVCYDEIHYYIHHVQSRVAYFVDLRHYHHDHHYCDSTRGFGVTNKLWDWVFGTMLHMKT